MSYNSVTSYKSVAASGSPLDFSGDFSGAIQLCLGSRATISGTDLMANGKRLLLWGVNMVPPTLCYGTPGTINPQTGIGANYETIATALKRLGVNYVRLHQFDGDNGSTNSDGVGGLVDDTVSTNSYTLVSTQLTHFQMMVAALLNAGMWVSLDLYATRHYRPSQTETGNLDTVTGTSDQGHRSAKCLLQVQQAGATASLASFVDAALNVANPYRNNVTLLAEPNLIYINVVNEGHLTGVYNSASSAVKAYVDAQMNADGVAGSFASQTSAMKDWAAGREIQTLQYWQNQLAARGFQGYVINGNWGNTSVVSRGLFDRHALCVNHAYTGGIYGYDAVDSVESTITNCLALARRGVPVVLDEWDSAIFNSTGGVIAPSNVVPAAALMVGISALQRVSGLAAFHFLGSGMTDTEKPNSIELSSNVRGLFRLRMGRAIYKNLWGYSPMKDEPIRWTSDNDQTYGDIQGNPYTRLIRHTTQAGLAPTAPTLAERWASSDGVIRIEPTSGSFRINHPAVSVAYVQQGASADAGAITVLYSDCDCIVYAEEPTGASIQGSSAFNIGFYPYQLGSADAWTDSPRFHLATSLPGGTNKVLQGTAVIRIRTSKWATLAVKGLNADGSVSGTSCTVISRDSTGVVIRLDTGLIGSATNWFQATG